MPCGIPRMLQKLTQSNRCCYCYKGGNLGYYKQIVTFLFVILNPIMTNKEKMMKSTTILAIGLGIVIFTLLWANHEASAQIFDLDGVELLEMDPDTVTPSTKFIVNKEYTFRIKVRAKRNEKLETIHIYPSSKSHLPRYKPKTCRWPSNKTCEYSVTLKFTKHVVDRPSSWTDNVTAKIITESKKTSTVEWKVTVHDGTQAGSLGYFHLSPANDREISVDVGKYKKFTALWTGSQVGVIVFTAKNAKIKGNPKYTFVGIPKSKLEHSVLCKWNKPGKYTVKVYAYISNPPTGEPPTLSTVEKPDKNPETWTVIVGGPAEVAITQKTPIQQNVHLLPNDKQEFSIDAMSSENIKSITFNALGARGNAQRKGSWHWGKERRYSATYKWKQPGRYTVTATVETKSGAIASTAWTVNVGNFPQQGVEIPNQSIYVNKIVSINLAEVFSNPDGGALTYSKRLSQKGIVAVEWNKARTEMTLEGVEPGTVFVTVKATNRLSGLATQHAFKVTVRNRAPKVKSQIPTIRGLTPGGPVKRLYMSSYFTDPDGDTLTYQSRSNNTGVASVKMKGSTLRITPVAGGKAEITVTAKDGHSNTGTPTSFSVIVNKPPTNLSYDTLSDLQNLVIDKYVWVQVNATDADTKKRQLTYAVEATKGGVVEAEFRTRTRANEHSPNMRIKPINIGTDTLKVTVSDGISSSTLDIPVKVPESDTNRAKAKSDLAILELTASKNTVKSGETFSLDVSVENKGAAATSTSKTLDYYLWSNPPTAVDWQNAAAFETSSVKKLNAGEVYVAKSINIKAPTSAGIYYYGAYVFPDQKESYSNWDNNRSNVIEITVTGQNSQNRPPSVIIVNPKNLTFEITGFPYAIYVSELFRDPDGDLLRYRVQSSDPSVATARIGQLSEHGEDLIIIPLRAGTTTITMIATDRQQQTATLIINLTVTGGAPQDDYWIDRSLWRFQNFHVVYHNLPETADLSEKIRTVSGMRLADWNDIVAYYNAGGSMADFMHNLGIQGGQGYHVTWNGAEIWNGGLADGRKRRYYFERHDHNKPELFLAHADIDNHLLTLGSWYSTGGLALCYGTPNQNWYAAPLRIHIPVTPASTAVLPNYPNPFNPETWIPYQLATPAAVTLAIYNAQGTLVRQLALGHQPAGFYHDRSRAAYWDGRNSQGERVASGVYFYQFQAGNVSSLRKMLILK